jgi:Fic family protein
MDLTGWLEYFSGGLATQLEEVKARGTAAIHADVLARANRLNARQSALLAELFAAGRLAVGDLDGLFPNVNRRTLQRDLKKLLEKGLLREIGTGPTDPNRHYVPEKL